MNNNIILTRENTPKLFFYLAIALIGLVAAYTSFVMVASNIADYYFANNLTTWSLSRENRVYTSILIVSYLATPFFFILISHGINNSKFSINSKIFQWMIYIAIAILSIFAITDLIYLVFRFLDGDLTKSTLIKISIDLLALFSIIGYLFIVLNNIISFARKILVFIFAAFVVAFLLTNFHLTPSVDEVVKMKSDINKTNKAIDVFYALSEYYKNNEKLPNNLELVTNNSKYFSSHEKDSIGDAGISFDLIDKSNFKICASFDYSAELVKENVKYENGAIELFDNASKYDNHCFVFNVDKFDS